MAARTVQDSILAERDRWFLWSVVAFATGSGIYFALGFEPSFQLATATALAACAVSVAGFRSPGSMLRFSCILVAATGFGFAAAKLRTERVAAPVISEDIGPLTIEGRIESVFVQDATHARILLAPSRIGNNEAALPRRLRLTLRGERAVGAAIPGANVSLLAMVRPPPEPAQPGGYDFARWAFFSGIGGVGFVLGAPRPLESVPVRALLQPFGDAIERLRRSMSSRIQAALPEAEGAIAAALITGERAAISDADNNAYRDSGLFHVLSISGVHMALAGLGIFWVVRALLALFPSIVLNYPVKKWAALAAVAGATFYLFISGAGAPAVRSYIMLVAMLVGVLADRPALSMRAVGISALLILMVEPEGVIEASFQMSFAAIIGLIALAEWQRSRPVDATPPPTGIMRVLIWARRYVLGLALASIVAGLATAPFAIYHFDRAPGYSLLANLLATPVVGVVIMPAACFTVVLMPFGLEYWPLQLMGWGVGVMTEVAHGVADLPGAVNLVPAKSTTALVLIVVGGLWISLWQTNWRWLGLAAGTLGLALAALEKAPDILISRDAQAAAVRGPDGRLILMGDPDDYTAAQWLLHDGDARDISLAKNNARCDEWGCVVQGANGEMISLALRVGALADDCARADILISTVPLRRPCTGPRQVVDRFDVYWQGAMALYVAPGAIRMITVRAQRGLRPWSGLNSGE